MANYVITRATQQTDVYGCTNFSTNQEVGQVASVLPNAPLDGTITWYLDANNGYTVNVDDFDIPNTQVSNIASPIAGEKTLIGFGIPSPVLGVTFKQTNTTRITLTLHLHPDANFGITGNAFTMPSSDVNISLQIEGCAKIRGEHVSVVINRPSDDVTTTAVDILGDWNDVNVNVLNAETSDEVVGFVPGFDNEPRSDRAIFTYDVIAKEG